MKLTDRQLEQLLAPPLQTSERLGIGGVIRQRCEDFFVRELPAYAADGTEQGPHLLLTLKKRNLGSAEALAAVADHCGLSQREFGLAGLKDKRAVTEQWVSAPFATRELLKSFDHPQIALGPASPHSNKLRRGHLRGNRFAIVVRELCCPVPEAWQRAMAKVEALGCAGGVINLYGQQRFGRDGHNATRGLALLAAPKRARRRGKADFVLSAGQSALFNLYLLERWRRGLLRTVLAGDVLQKTATGGLFVCNEPEVDQRRMDAGEVAITGPMFGSKMPAPTPGSPADSLECAILEEFELSREGFRAFGRKLSGARRRLQISLEQMRVDVVPITASDPGEILPEGAPNPGSEPGLLLQWVLPPGAYATCVLREVMGPSPEVTAPNENA